MMLRWLLMVTVVKATVVVVMVTMDGIIVVVCVDGCDYCHWNGCIVVEMMVIRSDDCNDDRCSSDGCSCSDGNGRSYSDDGCRVVVKEDKRRLRRAVAYITPETGGEESRPDGTN